MSIQSSVNQAVQGIMSTVIPMSLLKEQGKVGQLKAQQKELIKENEEWTKQNVDLVRRNEKEVRLWQKILANSPKYTDPPKYTDLVDFLYDNPYSVGDKMAGTVATQRVQSEQEKRKSQMENLQKAFQNIGMGGNDNG